MVLSMSFDGHDLSDYLIVQFIEGRGPFHKGLEKQVIPGMDGALGGNRRVFPRPLRVHATVIANGFEELRSNVDAINNVLYTSDAVPIVFSDEPNITYYGEFEGASDWAERNAVGSGIIPITCLDPYKYSQETSTIIYEPNSTESSIVTLFADQKHEFETNESSINALPIFNVEFSASTSKFEIFHRQSRRRLTVTYDFEAGDTLTLNARNRRVQINGNTRMPTLTMDSAWFDLVSGDNSFEVTDGVATVTLRYRTRWL